MVCPIPLVLAALVGGCIADIALHRGRAAAAFWLLRWAIKSEGERRVSAFRVRLWFRLWFRAWSWSWSWCWPWTAILCNDVAVGADVAGAFAARLRNPKTVLLRSTAIRAGNINRVQPHALSVELAAAFTAFVPGKIYLRVIVTCRVALDDMWLPRSAFTSAVNRWGEFVFAGWCWIVGLYAGNRTDLVFGDVAVAFVEVSNNDEVVRLPIAWISAVVAGLALARSQNIPRLASVFAIPEINV